MSKYKRTKAFLLLGVMLLGFLISGCAPEQPTKPSETEPGLNTIAFAEIIDANNIEKIVVYPHIYSSIRLDIDNQSDLQAVIGILEFDKEQIDSSFDFSQNDVSLIIDVIYNNNVISIQTVSSNNGIYYIVEDYIYKCSEQNHLLLVDFIYEKINGKLPDSEFDYIEK